MSNNTDSPIRFPGLAGQGGALLPLLALCLGLVLPNTALAEKYYQWVDKKGQTHITSHYPSKSLRKPGSKVEIIDSNDKGSSIQVIKTDSLSDEQRREISKRKKKQYELSSEKARLERNKTYLEQKVRKLKIDLRRLEKKSSSGLFDEGSDDQIENQKKIDKTKSSLADSSKKLLSTELRVRRLQQELENLK